jgi:hypothetical protein
MAARIVRRMRPFLKMSAVALVLLSLYIGTFSYWWLSSPVKKATAKNGRAVRIVEFQFNKVSWYTQIIWIPAFWFMEHGVGYQEVGFVAMYDQSIMRYGRYAD